MSDHDINDEFLRKLYQKTVSKDGIETIDRYEIGVELRLDNARTEIIVDELNNYGYVRKTEGKKIMITDEGQTIARNM
jgi:Mn-dependent DtxR family transcriptional regulator